MLSFRWLLGSNVGQVLLTKTRLKKVKKDMVYKPRKTVNGHKRNDRSTRRRKARDARKRRAAARPVRSNIKRYVAEQFGKTHPDNRYYLSFPALKPTNKLDDTPRYYPFGATFQEKFLKMEFIRMKEVISQLNAQRPSIGGTTPNDALIAQAKIGDFNHWKSLLGRGIHMKHSSVYGTITLNEKIPVRMQEILLYGNLKLHMFVLEDKAVTKTEFLNWYKEFLKTKSDGTYSTAVDDYLLSEGVRTVVNTNDASNPTADPAIPLDHGSYDQDIQYVPYVAGSKYTVGSNRVCGEGSASHERPPSGFDEFLIDWRKFYETNESTAGTSNPVTDNPEHSLFYNEVKCTTSWDGSRDKSVLPVNKSRFIVHEHKTWSFKPRANGCLDTVIPFEYSFPEHYMHYDKELLDMPFVWNTVVSEGARDDRGLDRSWLYPRKQPFIVFVYTCDNPMIHNGPDLFHDITYGNSGAEVRNADNSGANSVLDGNAGSDPSSTAMDTNLGVSPNEIDEQKDGALRTKKVKLHASDNTQTAAEVISAESNVVAKGNVFSIDMHFKCTYENKLATSIVPTINKGRPIIHKRESAPRTRTSAKRPRKPTIDAGPPHGWQEMLRAQNESLARDAGRDMRAAMRRKEESLLPSSISKKSAHARDYKNLQIAKNMPNGIYVRNGRMYIFGTRDGEAVKSWPHIATRQFKNIPRYKEAKAIIESHGGIRGVVGHSKGAAVAHQLIMDYPHLKGRGYAYPHARLHSDARFQTFRHFGDPASMLDFHAKTSDKPYRGPYDAHSSSGYTGKYAKYKQDL